MEKRKYRQLPSTALVVEGSCPIFLLKEIGDQDNGSYNPTIISKWAHGINFVFLKPTHKKPDG
jgi:hypothetical protein